MTNSVDRGVGGRVRDLRIAKGLGVDVVGSALGLAARGYAARGSGAVRFRAQELFDLAAIFGEPMSAFYDGLARDAPDAAAG